MLTGPARAALYAAMCKFSFLILPETGAKQLMRNEALSVVPEEDAMGEEEPYRAWELRKPIAVKKLVLMVSFFFSFFFYCLKNAIILSGPENADQYPEDRWGIGS